ALFRQRPFDVIVGQSSYLSNRVLKGGAEVDVTRKVVIELFSFNFDSNDDRSRFMIGGGELDLTLVLNSGVDIITMH
ncbi:unnamed protein product, partial [Rotaria sordida]